VIQLNEITKQFYSLLSSARERCAGCMPRGKVEILDYLDRAIKVLDSQEGRDIKNSPTLIQTLCAIRTRLDKMAKGDDHERICIDNQLCNVINKVLVQEGEL